MIFSFVIVLVINKIISNVQVVHGLKLTPVQRTTQKVDITDEVKIISSSVQNAYLVIKQHEVALIEPKVTLKSDEIINLTSLISRWHMMEEKLQIPASIIESKLKEITIYDEINYQIALGKVMVGNLLLKSKEYDLAASELKQACINLWSYKAIAYQNLETNGWLECYNSIYELYKHSNNIEGINNIANHLSKSLPWLSNIIKDVSTVNNVKLLELFHNLNTNDKEIIGKSISNTWFVANILRKKFQLLLHDFLNASKRIQLSIYLKAQKLFESVVFQFQEDFSLKIPLESDETQLDLLLLQKYLVGELQQENSIYLSLMTGILDNGEEFLRNLDYLQSTDSSSVDIVNLLTRADTTATTPMIGFHSESFIISLFYKLRQKIQEKDSENYRRYNIEDTSSTTTTTTTTTTTSDTLSLKDGSKTTATSSEDMRGQKNIPSSDKANHQQRKKKTTSNSSSTSSSSSSSKKSKRSNSNSQNKESSSSRSSSTEHSASASSSPKETNKNQNTKIPNSTNIDWIGYFYMVCSYLYSIAFSGIVYVIIAAIGGYYIRMSKTKAPAKSNKRIIPVIPSGLSRLSNHNNNTSSNNNSNNSNIEVTLSYNAITSNTTCGNSNTSDHSYQNMVMIQLHHLQLFLKQQQDHIILFNYDITWKTILHTCICLKLFAIFLYSGIRYLIEELLYNYMFVKQEVNITGVCLLSNNTLKFVNELDVDYLSKNDGIANITTSSSTQQKHKNNHSTKQSKVKVMSNRINKTIVIEDKSVLVVTTPLEEETSNVVLSEMISNDANKNTNQELEITSVDKNLYNATDEEKLDSNRYSNVDSIKDLEAMTVIASAATSSSSNNTFENRKDSEYNEEDHTTGEVPCVVININSAATVPPPPATTTTQVATTTGHVVTSELSYRDDWKNIDYENYFSQEDKEGDWIVYSSSNHHNKQQQQQSKSQLRSQGTAIATTTSSSRNDKHISTTMKQPSPRNMKPLSGVVASTSTSNGTNSSTVQSPKDTAQIITTKPVWKVSHTTPPPCNSTTTSTTTAATTITATSNGIHTTNNIEGTSSSTAIQQSLVKKSRVASPKIKLPVKQAATTNKTNNNKNVQNNNNSNNNNTYNNNNINNNNNNITSSNESKQSILPANILNTHKLSEDNDHSSLSDNISEVTSLDGGSSTNVMPGNETGLYPNHHHHMQPEALQQASMMYLSMLQQQYYHQQPQQMALMSPQMIPNMHSMIPGGYQPQIMYSSTSSSPYQQQQHLVSNKNTLQSEDSSIIQGGIPSTSSAVVVIDDNNCGETTSSGSGHSLSIQIPITDHSTDMYSSSSTSNGYEVRSVGVNSISNTPSYLVPANYYTQTPVMFHGSNIYYNNYHDGIQQMSPIMIDDTELLNVIQMQIEYYFSEKNLSNDMYFRNLMDIDGYVLLYEIIQFRRITKLGATPYQILMAIQQSKLLDLDCLDIINQAKGNRYLIYALTIQNILQTKLRCIDNPKSWTLIKKP